MVFVTISSVPGSCISHCKIVHAAFWASGWYVVNITVLPSHGALASRGGTDWLRKKYVPGLLRHQEVRLTNWKWQVPELWHEGVRLKSEWACEWNSKVRTTCVWHWIMEIGSLHVVQNVGIDRWELAKFSLEVSKFLGSWNPHVWDIPNLHWTNLLRRENAIPQSIRSKIMRTLQQHLWEATSKDVTLAARYQKTALGGQIVDTSFEIPQIELGDFSTFAPCFDRASKPKSCCWWCSCVDEGWWLPSIFNRHRYCVRWWHDLQDQSARLQAHGIVANEFICSQCAVNIPRSP